MTTVRLDLYYPRAEILNRGPNKPVAIVVGLCDVRAADPMLIEYCFERDGYKISMPTVSEWDETDKVCNPCYREVAFLPARIS
jgi:hypothetical protein